jgi:hypothetical protein
MAHRSGHLTGLAGHRRYFTEGSPALRRLGRAFALIPTLFFSALGATAASPTTAADERTLHFRVFSAEPMQSVTYLPATNGKETPLVFFPSARSPRYDYRGGMPIRFRSDSVEIAAVNVPPQIEDALLIFDAIPSAATGPRYRVYVHDDAAARHAAFELSVINFSGLRLSGVIGGREVHLDEGLNPSIAIGRTTDVLLRTIFKGRSVQACARRIELSGRERALMILFPPYYPGSLEVQSRVLVDEPGTADSK